MRTQRLHASRVHGKLFFQNGKLFLFRLMSRVPSCSLNELHDLDFEDSNHLWKIFSPPNDRIEVVDLEFLADISKCLARWKKAYLQTHEEFKKSDQAFLAGERLAIQKAEVRLKQLEEVHRQVQFQRTPGLVLLPDEESEFQQRNRQLPGIDAIPRMERKERLFITNLLRLVYWRCGGLASQNFVSSLVSFNQYFPVDNTQKFAVNWIEWLESLRVRIGTQPKWQLYEELNSHPMMEEFKRLANELGCGKKWKTGNLDNKIRKLQAAAREVMTESRKCFVRHWPSRLARWCLLAYNHEFFPEVLFKVLPLHSQHIGHLQSRFENATSTQGFGRLLSELDLSSIPVEDWPQVIEYCGQNETVNVIQAWGRYPIYLLANERVDDVKVLADRFESAMPDCGGQIFRTLIGSLDNKIIWEFAHRIVEWTEMFGSGFFTAKINERVSGFLDRTVRMIRYQKIPPSVKIAIDRWAQRRSGTRCPVVKEHEFPRELAIWLRRIGHYRRLEGKKTSLPGKLVDFIEFRDRRGKELIYLAERLGDGSADQKMQQRFEHLISSQDAEIDVGRALRIAKESCLSGSLDALNFQFETIARTALERAGIPDSDYVRDVGPIKLFLWLEQMESKEKRNLRSTMQAFREHGEQYKRWLPANKKWIRQARKRGINVEQWLDANRQVFSCGSTELRLSLAVDPTEIFQMGYRFDTCLSPGQCNEMAVLTNASDANKQVLYLFDKYGNRIGRKLLAITSEWKLAGYRLYLSEQRHQQEAIQKIVEKYCFELASRIGIPLLEQHDSAEIETFDGQFWYDDGHIPWDCPADVSSETPASVVKHQE